MFHRTLFLALLALCLASCNGAPLTAPAGDKADPGPIPGSVAPDTGDRQTLRDHHREMTIENCYLVRDAAEAFAANNGGIYPETTHQKGVDDRDLIDYFPTPGLLLMHPSNHVRNLPVDGAPAASYEVGYLPIILQGEARGYRIEGIDHLGNELIRFTQEP